MQNVAAALAHECENFNRLFWVSDAMVAKMRKMGLESLAGSKHDGEGKLGHMLASIDMVKWHLVDPCGTNCAANSSNGTPIFTSGDAVSWDKSLGVFGGLCIVSRLQRFAYESRMCGEHLVGGMTAL